MSTSSIDLEESKIHVWEMVKYGTWVWRKAKMDRHCYVDLHIILKDDLGGCH